MKENLILSYGTDPELMVADCNGRILSSLDVVKKDKHDPIKLGDGYLMYADNVLVETSMPAAFSVEGAVNNMGTAFGRMQKELSAGGFSMVPQAAHRYEGLPPKPDDELVIKWLEWDGPTNENPYEVHPAWQVGCKPNWDAYLADQRKQRPFQDSLRTGSFHIHVGNVNYQSDAAELLMTAESKLLAVKLMDVFVGLSSILFDKDPTSKDRKALYGKAGEFRGTKYGIEYRTLGNYALRDPELTAFVFKLTKHAMEHLKWGTGEGLLTQLGEIRIQAAINTNDRSEAWRLLDKAGLPVKLNKELEGWTDCELSADNFDKAWAL